MSLRSASLVVIAALLAATCGSTSTSSNDAVARETPENLAYEVTPEPFEIVDTSSSAVLCADITGLFSGKVAVTETGSEQTTALMRQTKNFVGPSASLVLDGLIALTNGEPGSTEYLLGIEQSPAFWDIDAATFDLCGVPLVAGMRDMGHCYDTTDFADQPASDGTPLSCHQVRTVDLGGLCFTELAPAAYVDPEGVAFEARTFERSRCPALEATS